MGNDLRGRVAQRAANPNGSGGTAPAVRAETSVTDIAQQQKPLTDLVRDMEPEFRKAAPKGVEAVQVVRDVLTLISTTPKLKECVPLTVLGGAMTMAQLGLRPGVLGHGWLLPFWDNRAKVMKAQLVIGYKGYVELINRSGRVSGVGAHAVHERDLFELGFENGRRIFTHRPNWWEDRGPLLGWYAAAQEQGFDTWTVTDPMSVAQMEEHRDRFAMAKKEGQIVGPWRDHFEAMARKGLALDTPIPTVEGWSTMGDLAAGDLVFDLEGRPTTVLAVSEVKHIDCYRVTFANGAQIVCDGEHVWLAGIGRNAGRSVKESGWREYKIGDLHAARQCGEAVVMPVVAPLTMPEAVLPVDPWVLGYWLGDGSTGNATISCHADQATEVHTAIRAAGYAPGDIIADERSESAVRINVRGLRQALREAGVLHRKHVPAAYMRASAEQRLALLQGLIDSDGHVDLKRGRVHFANTDKGLTDAVAELARSLGEVVHRGERDLTGFGRTVRAYEVSWKPTWQPATLQGKASRWKPRQIRPYRSVKSIELIESVPTRCIAVDSPTRTYLAGEEMVPTHNTMILRLAGMLPKSTEVARAIEVDGSVRVDLAADGIDRSERVIDGEVVDDVTDPPAGGEADSGENR